MTNPALRARYLADTVTTASPTRLLVMLYDRLAVDLARGEEALEAADRETAATRLQHAQDIILELQLGLNREGWAGSDALAQIYTFLLTELVTANIHAEPGRVAACRGLVEPLRDAWRQAATDIATPVPAERIG